MTTSEARSYETKGLAYKRYTREFPVTEDALLPVGTTITALHFVPGQFVDVQATTRGKGFQGAVRRWGFKGQSATHGTTKAERKIGSMGGVRAIAAGTFLWPVPDAHRPPSHPALSVRACEQAAGSMFATRVFKGKKMVSPPASARNNLSHVALPTRPLPRRASRRAAWAIGDGPSKGCWCGRSSQSTT